MAQVRRKAVEELTLRKIMTVTSMSAALYANTNLDSKENEGKRGQMIDEFNGTIEEKFAETLAIIYGAEDPNAIEEADMSDPFFAAMKIPGNTAVQHPTDAAQE